MCCDAVFRAKENKTLTEGRNFTLMSKQKLRPIDQQIKSNKNDRKISELHVILRRTVILRFWGVAKMFQKFNG